jgi:ATP-dependent DNA helicase RecG
MKLHEIPIKSLPRTSGRSIKLLELMNIHTYQDLLQHFPFRYEDYSKVVPITHLFDAENVRTAPAETTSEETSELLSTGKLSIQGTIQRFDTIKTRRGFQMQKIFVEDESGKVDVTWFNQPYLRTVMKPGIRISLSGFVKEYQGKLSFQAEEYELPNTADEITLHTARIVPVYQQMRGISSKTIREKIWYVLQTYGHAIEKTLPAEIAADFKLVEEIEAYTKVHFPTTARELTGARDRIAFDELFIVQLTSHLIKREWKSEVVGKQLEVGKHEAALASFKKSLPFKLTSAQDRTISEITTDLAKQHPMNRLLQGDVGSGKTIVAAAAAYITHLNGYTSLVMAPTEILAQQHLESLIKTFAALPADQRPRITLLTSSVKPPKAELDEATIIVGTHALISSSVDFSKVALVVVDEQHKFGVVQRAKLKEKGAHPHLLSMTATPIPRTVTLTLYGELDVSIIDEMPAGRKEIKTYVVPPNKREDAYAWIAKDITAESAQVFVVCPLIDESETESMKSVKAASVEFENLQKHFPSARLGLLHGRQKKAEKDAVLADFSAGKLDILISTPVVEVGIDIPNATIMLIETAERFGLAQLHQLRGRVGRSDKQSHCLLFTEQTNPFVLNRLKTFSQTHDGFKLAEYDLQNRGSGNMYGIQQHGASDLQIASLTDLQLIERTQKAVEQFMASKQSIEEIPELQRRLQKYQIKHISRD